MEKVNLRVAFDNMWVGHQPKEDYSLVKNVCKKYCEICDIEVWKKI